MSEAWLAVGCVMPIGLLIGLRYGAFRRRMDSRAKRAYAKRSVGFLLPALALSLLLLTHRGGFPLPAVWGLVLAGATGGLIVGCIRRR